MSFKLPRSKIRMPLEGTAVAVGVGILARDLEGKECFKIECISWNREGAEDPNTVMEERLGRNIIHKSRSMAACPGLEQPERLGRGTLGSVTRAGVEYCRNIQSWTPPVWLLPNRLFTLHFVAGSNHPPMPSVWVPICENREGSCTVGVESFKVGNRPSLEKLVFWRKIWSVHSMWIWGLHSQDSFKIAKIERHGNLFLLSFPSISCQAAKTITTATGFIDLLPFKWELNVKRNEGSSFLLKDGRHSSHRLGECQSSVAATVILIIVFRTFWNMAGVLEIWKNTDAASVVI